MYWESVLRIREKVRQRIWSWKLPIKVYGENSGIECGRRSNLPKLTLE